MMKSRLLCSTLLISAAMAGHAFAQDVPVAVTTVTQEDLEQTTTVDAVILTGTRLRLPEYTSPSPTVSQSAEQIERSGDGNLIEFLTDIPQLVNSTTDVVAADQSTPSLVGLNLLNLRNLGETRTLVLVNGRRHVAGLVGTSAVDVNTIPVDLVERVDIVTGGASAVYGADGVSGVVNFILKDNYQGVTTRAQYGTSDAGGGSTKFVSVLAGRNFMEDRLNLTLSAEMYSRDDLDFEDRRYTRTGDRFTLFPNPDDPVEDLNGNLPGDPDYNPDNGVPDQILFNDVHYIDTSLGGSFYADFTFFPEYLADGSPFIVGDYLGDFFMQGGSGTSLDLFNDDLVPGSDRWSVNLMGRFDLTNTTRIFTEFKHVDTKADFIGQPTYDYGLAINLDHPFLPANVLADSANGWAGVYGFIPLARDNFDLGRTTVDNGRQTDRAVIAVNTALRDNLEFEASYVWGRTREQLHTGNVRINERFYAATDIVETAPGVYECRSTLDPTAAPIGDFFAQPALAFDPAFFGTTFTPGAGSGCVPVNILQEGAFSQEALDWINTETTDRSEIEQEVFTAFFTGSTDGYFSIPNGGPISYVIGGEYRKESSEFLPDSIRVLADTLDTYLTSAGRASVTRGEYDVAEFFSEVEVPLIVNKPYGKLVALQGAYRYSDYSTAGKSHTWNFGGRWQFNNTFMLRGAIATAVRAPNVNNLFRGLDQTFATIVDPCDDDEFNQGENPVLRSQQCAADFAQYGLTVGSGGYNDTSSEAVAGFLAGNLLLKPETAYTKTLGFVYTPEYIPGFQMSVDYYAIRIEDAIASYTAQAIVNNCYDLPQPNQFCDLIERQELGDPNPGRISGFMQVPGNLATFRTKGTDFTVRYNLDPARFGMERDIGTFNFSLVGTFLDELQTKATSDAPVSRDDGDVGAPTFQGNFDVTWDFHNWEVNYGFSYFNETRRVSRVTRVNEPDYVEQSLMNYDAHKVHDLRVAYNYKDRYQVYAGVNNITDQEPEAQDYIYPVDPIGRYFYIGLRAELQ